MCGTLNILMNICTKTYIVTRRSIECSVAGAAKIHRFDNYISAVHSLLLSHFESQSCKVARLTRPFLHGANLLHIYI